MNQPEWYRDDVSPAGGSSGTRTDVLRGQGESEPASRDLLRDGVVREPTPREALRETAGRVVGSPLPAGNSLGGSSSLTEGQPHKAPPGRALTGASSGPGDDPSSMQRAMGILKQAAPFVARLLPLLDGNFATALANVFAPRGHTPPPTVSVDLTPVHHQLAELQEQQNELRSAVQDQTTGIKRVEDQLEMVREATDRNTLEQQELMEDLKAMASKVNLVAAGLSALLLLSVIMNLVLYLYVKKVLP